MIQNIPQTQVLGEKQQHPKAERTLVVIKPDGVQRGLIGEVISRFERVGLKLVGLKLITPTLEHIEKHYTLDAGWKFAVGTKSIEAYAKQGRQQWSTDPIEVATKILGRLQAYLSSGPVVAMVWQGAHAVPLVRKLVGSTEPLSSDVGTIRGDYMLDSYFVSDLENRAIRNVVHASGSDAEAQQEIAHWFNANEVQDYRLIQEVLIYDVNADGAKE